MNKFAIIALGLTVKLLLAACNKNNNDDESKPYIVLLGPNPLNWAFEQPYLDPGAEAYDIVGSDTVNISSRLVMTDNVDVSTVGAYQVNYNVTDTDGNSANQETRTVNIVVGK
jgi:hypothetical protein